MSRLGGKEKPLGGQYGPPLVLVVNVLSVLESSPPERRFGVGPRELSGWPDAVGLWASH